MAKAKTRKRPRQRTAKKGSDPGTKMIPRANPESTVQEDAAAAKGTGGALQQGAQNMLVAALMGTLLVLFLVIAVLAPDPSRPGGHPGFSTVLWRLVLLLVPLGIMYGLLFWDKILKFVQRR